MNRKVKVLFFTTALTYGGTEKVLINYLNHLAQSGKFIIDLVVMFEVTSIPVLENSLNPEISLTYLSTKNTGNFFYNLVLSYSYSYINKLFYVFFRLFYNLIFYKKFIEKVNQENYQSLICFDTGLPNYITRYRKLNKILWIHFSTTDIFGNFWKRTRTRIWVNKLKKYNTLIAISKGVESQLKSFNLNNVIHVYNPVDPNIIQKSKEPFDLPSGVGTNQYIVSVARLEENQKDNTLLIKSIALIRDMYGLKYNLIIVGDGRDKMHLENLIVLYGLELQVFLVGNKANPYPYILNSSLFVLSSKFEGLGVVLIEALFLNKLIISSDCKVGPSEILNHKDILVKVGDVQDMAEKIHNILNNPVLQQEVYQHLSLQKAKFSPSSSYSKIEELLTNQRI